MEAANLQPTFPHPYPGRRPRAWGTGRSCLAGAVCPRSLPCGRGKVVASVRMDREGVHCVDASPLPYSEAAGREHAPRVRARGAVGSRGLLSDPRGSLPASAGHAQRLPLLGGRRNRSEIPVTCPPWGGMVRQPEGLVANTVPVSSEGRRAGTGARAPRCCVLDGGWHVRNSGFRSGFLTSSQSPGSASLYPTDFSVEKP